MPRNKLLTLLMLYSPVLKSEQIAKQKIIAFVNTHPACFERTLNIGHITGSSWLLNQNMEKALLMHHRKLNMWLQLGGHCDGDSDVLAVAIKETREESGVADIVPISFSIFDLDIHEIPGNAKEEAHTHYDIRFLFKINSDEQVQQNLESNKLRWINKDKTLLPTQETGIVRMFDKWLALNTY